MLYYPSLISIIEVLLVTLPALLAVAYVTVAERKILASMQRRLGPNIIGYYGSLQAFADALKLLLKEYISPTQANIILFFLGPFITLVFSLLGYAVIPYGPGLAITDFNLGILYILAVSSLSTYGILLAGWSANSKYAFLGSLRSTAQLISYELILSSAILLVVLLTGSLNLTVNIEAQRAVWFIVPLLPIFIVFFIGSIAETNRAPFDLAEAESELVSGFMTEHAAVIFVFFFLAEYASIALICILVATLFMGGYLFDITFISYVISTLFDYCMDFLFFIITLIQVDFNTISFSNLINGKITTINPLTNSLSSSFIFHQYSGVYSYFFLDIFYQNTTFVTRSVSTIFDHLTQGLYYGLVLALKSFSMIFVFIWARACFPRIRFDQLMLFCWTILLPIVIGFILLLPCFIYFFDSIPSNFCLLASFFMSFNDKKACCASKTLILTRANIPCFSTSAKKNFSNTNKLLMPEDQNVFDNFEDELQFMLSELIDNRAKKYQHNRLVSFILRFYFNIDGPRIYMITPNFEYRGGHSPIKTDYTLERFDKSISNPHVIDLTPQVIVSVNITGQGYSWNVLMTQLISQCEHASEKTGEIIYVIVSRGLEICIFVYDKNERTDGLALFRNFYPLNIRDYDRKFLSEHNINFTWDPEKLRFCAVYLRLDIEFEQNYIHDILLHIKKFPLSKM